jgi:hypothetical protein
VEPEAVPSDSQKQYEIVKVEKFASKIAHIPGTEAETIQKQQVKKLKMNLCK